MRSYLGCDLPEDIDSLTLMILLVSLYKNGREKKDRDIFLHLNPSHKSQVLNKELSTAKEKASHQHRGLPVP